MEQSIWQEIGKLYQKFQELGISEAVDYEKYYLYSLITHSTAIEGSTLTEAEAQMLFDEGLTAKGKPLVYHLMNEDLKKAYELKYSLEVYQEHALEASSSSRAICSGVSPFCRLDRIYVEISGDDTSDRAFGIQICEPPNVSTSAW